MSGTAQHHCLPSVAVPPSSATQLVRLSDRKKHQWQMLIHTQLCLGLGLRLAVHPRAGGTGSPEHIQQEPAQGSIPKPQTCSRSQAVSKFPPQSLLTILQGPLDVPCALADGVEVPIQCGDEEQCFWDSHSTAFEALGQTHRSQELSQTWEQSPSPGPLHSSAPEAAAPSVTSITHTYSPWLCSTAHIPPEPSWGWSSLPSPSSPWNEFFHRWDELQCGCSQSQPWMPF